MSSLKALSWPEREKRLQSVFSQAFPSASPELVEQCARKVGDQYSNSLSVEAIERSDKNPALDFEELSAATKSIESAIKRLKKVGWHGGKAIVLAAKSKQQSGSRSTTGLPNRYTDAGCVVADRLEEHAELLREAAELIPSSAPLLISGSDRNAQNQTKRTKPQLLGAKSTARACASAFYLLNGNGKRPTVIKSPSDNAAYGDYIELIGNVFDQLGIEASSETWATESSKWFRTKGILLIEEFL